ncbi:MAG: hypothetical protein HYV09_27505 [Deltaproteobacteria bacterium]|nr:hypothetical protein [Deltaproteobacteria bacterium]
MVAICSVNAGFVAALLLAGRRWCTSERRSLRWRLAMAATTLVLANAVLRLVLRLRDVADALQSLHG